MAKRTPENCNLTKEVRLLPEDVDDTDSFLSDMIVSKLLIKWVGSIFSDACYALCKYYMHTGNVDCGCMPVVESLFREIDVKMQVLIPVLEDMVSRDIRGIEDIFIAVYGVGSDEVYVMRRFLELFGRMGEWDEDYMWNDCGGDRRMLQILTRF